MECESTELDVMIVGGGPAGLAAAIGLKQLAAERQLDLSVCLIEKAAEIGVHILSGAVMDPCALNELMPDWQEQGAPIKTAVTEDRMIFLSETGGRQIPNALLPDSFLNDGNYIVRLGNVAKWLGEQAEALFDEAGAVKGVATGDMGLTREGEHGPNHQPGMELHIKYTLFAEGCRGHLGKQLEAKYKLRADADPQTYCIGIKALWEVPAECHVPGLVVHTAGWPMDSATYGGGFVYHLEDKLVSIGFVVGLNYTNPHLSLFKEMQRYKTHPEIRKFIEGGKRLAYGARAIAAGGLQSQPKLVFPSGALIGDDAGFFCAARIKGSHTAIKSCMLAAEAAFDALAAKRSRDELAAFPESFRTNWLHEELHKTRNFKPYMKKGLRMGSLLFGIDQKLFGGKVPWTLHNSADHIALKPAAECEKIAYPKPDGVLTFDCLSSVFLSNTNHEEQQPCHLQLQEAGVPISVNLAKYDAPEQRYCPASVYEIVQEEAGPHLQINVQNCVHCKTCDIKDLGQEISWAVPQGGEGPIYQEM